MTSQSSTLKRDRISKEQNTPHPDIRNIEEEMEEEEMTIEEALVTAIDFEHRVRDLYGRAAERTEDGSANKFFAAFAIEEQQHVDYLESRLIVWQSNGIIDTDSLETILPDSEWINTAWKKLKIVDLQQDFSSEIELLNEALVLEQKAMELYQELTEKLDGDAQKMFVYFLRIETSHVALVKTQIRAVEEAGKMIDISNFRIVQG